MQLLFLAYILFCAHVGWEAFNYFNDRRLLADATLLAVATMIVGFQIGIL
jgi:hypothetical protein